LAHKPVLPVLLSPPIFKPVGQVAHVVPSVQVAQEIEHFLAVLVSNQYPGIAAVHSLAPESVHVLHPTLSSTFAQSLYPVAAVASKN
jgi:hypothetical protein